jgi:hypothetical protein
MTCDGFYAVRCGNLDLLQRLMAEKHTSVKHTRWSGVTLLHRAADGAHVDVIRYLLDAGADTAAKTFRGGDTSLHVAMGAGHEKAALALLEGGAPWAPTKRKPKLALNNRGETPMKTAVRQGYTLMAQRLEMKYYIFEAQRDKEAALLKRSSREPTPNPTPRQATPSAPSLVVPPPPIDERSEGTAADSLSVKTELPEAAPPAPAGLS